VIRTQLVFGFLGVFSCSSFEFGSLFWLFVFCIAELESYTDFWCLV